MRWLRNQSPATIVLASSDIYLNRDDLVLRSAAGSRVSGRAAKARAWQAGLETLIRQLQGAGHRVVLLEQLPHFLQRNDPRLVWRATGCPMLRLLQRVASCGQSETRARLDELQAPVLKAERGAARNTDVVLVKLRSALCLDGRCGTNRDRTWLYRDGYHLSRFGSEMLVEPLGTAIGP